MNTTSTPSLETSSITKDIIPSVETQNLPEPESNNINAPSVDQENHEGLEIEMPRGFLTNSIRDTLYSFIEGFSSAKKKKPSTLENVEAVPMQGLSPDKTITIEAGKSATKEGEPLIQLEDAQVQPEFITQEELLTKEKESEVKVEIAPAAQIEALQENIPVSEELPTETIPIDNHNEVAPVTMEIIPTETQAPVENQAIEPTLPLVPHNSNVEVQASAPSQDNTAMEIQNVMTLENLPVDETIEVTVEKTTVVTVTYEEQTISQQPEEPTIETPKSIEAPQTETESEKTETEENIIQQQQQQESEENSKMIEEEPKQITPPQTGNKSTEMYNASSERVKSLFRDTVASASKRAESLQKSQTSQKSQNNNLQTIQPRVLNLSNQANKPAPKPEQQLHKIELKKKTVTPNVLQPKNSHDVNLKKRKAGDAQIGVEDNNQLKKMKMNNFELTQKTQSKTVEKSTIQQGSNVLKENNPNGPKKVILKPTCVYCGQGLGDKKNVQMLSCLHKAHTKCYASSEKKKSSQCPACNSNSAIGGKFDLLNSKVMPRNLC